ncbi:ATP-binding cassette domain-containing protein [uncultured Microbacterium sp.]|uniref:ABC transporter ATP-binding protein n=1 Tax=uncultured Microbacterium sp. TaxID=191216 RepID=UPI0028F1215F|nr:ATP-binding cassette domain-containing protein [uncultured Microbacterium sp.]
MSALELIRVRKSYGAVLALADYSITVPSGSVTAFVGANGSGKSTAMRLLGGLRMPDSGEGMYNRRPLVDADRGRIGHSPEDRGLYPDEVVRAQLQYFAALIGLPRAETIVQVESALERVGLAEIADRRFAALSLGNRQRAQIALALLGSPEYLLLDEPFSGLDVDGLAQISELVRSLASDGVGVLVSSHQLEVVTAVSDRVAVIANGRSVLEGDLPAVLGTTERTLRLTFQLGTRDFATNPDPETGMRSFSDRLGGQTRRHADTLIVELPVESGKPVDPATLAAAAQLGPLVSVQISQPTLRELLAEQQ